MAVADPDRPSGATGSRRTLARGERDPARTGRRRARRRGRRRRAGDRQPGGRAPAAGGAARRRPGSRRWSRSRPAPALDGRRAARRGSTPAPWIGFNRRFQHGERLARRGSRRGASSSCELELRLPARVVAAAERGRRRRSPTSRRTSSTWRSCSRASTAARVRAARLSSTTAPSSCSTTSAGAARSAARPTARTASGSRSGRRRRRHGRAQRRRRPVAALTSRLPGRAHPLVASLRGAAAAPSRARSAAGTPACSRPPPTGARGDARDRRGAARRGASPSDVICVLQFDAASVAALERLLAARAACRTSPALTRARPAARARDARGRLRRRRLLHALQRGRARRPRDLLSVPVVRGRAARALRDGVRGAAGGLGAPRARRACGRWRSTRTRAARRRDARRHLRLRLGLRRPGRAAALVAPADAGRRVRAPSRARPAGDRDLRPPARRATCSRCARSCVAAPARVATLAERAARARALRPRLAHVQRRAPRRPPVLGPLAARRRRARRRASGRCSSGRSTDVYGAVDDAFGRVLAALPDGADVIVTSAVGMDVNTSRADLLPAMLARVLGGGPLRRRRRGRRDLAAAGGGARRALRASDRRRDPRPPALELTARLELRGIDWATTAGLRPPGRQPGLRPAQPARPRARRDRRSGARPTRCWTRSPRAWRRSAIRTASPPSRRSTVARPTSTRARARAGCPTSSCAGPSARRPRSRR